MLPGLKLIEADLRRLRQGRSRTSKFRLWLGVVHPRFAAVLLIRISQFLYRNSAFRSFSFFFVWMNVTLFGIEVTPRCKIGPGLLIPHSSGIVIGATEIGSNVTIFQGVTLGARFVNLQFSPDQRPVVEDNVVIGAGAKILGGIRIGANAVVAANSLVTESVPAGAFAIGCPAIITIRGQSTCC